MYLVGKCTKWCFTLTLQKALLSMIWLSSGSLSHPNHHDEGGSVLPGDCVRSQFRGVGAAQRDLQGSRRSSKTKGTLWHRLTHLKKHYFLSHQFQHPPHMSSLLHRTENPFLKLSAVNHLQLRQIHLASTEFQTYWANKPLMRNHCSLTGYVDRVAVKAK